MVYGVECCGLHTRTEKSDVSYGAEYESERVHVCAPKRYSDLYFWPKDERRSIPALTRWPGVVVYTPST